MEPRNLYVTIVLPAYNAEKTLERTIRDIPQGSVDELILVDDCSHDSTVPLARSLGLTVLQHPRNRGYGGNQKTCYRQALDRGADIVVMLHPDYQYDPKLIPHFVRFIAENYFDVMLGSRIRTRREALDGGMPPYKYYANRVLTLIENLVTGQNLSEWHTGMRAFSREVLESIPFEDNSDDFVFDTQVLFQVVERGFRIGEIPVPVRYFAEASSINLMRSIQYGLATLKVAFAYLSRKAFCRKADAIFGNPGPQRRDLKSETTTSPSGNSKTSDSIQPRPCQGTQDPIRHAIFGVEGRERDGLPRVHN